MLLHLCSIARIPVHYPQHLWITLCVVCRHARLVPIASLICFFVFFLPGDSANYFHALS